MTVIDLSHLDKIVDHLKGYQYTTAQFITVFKEKYPADWELLEGKYTKNDNQYTPYNYIGRMLKGREDTTGNIKFIGWIESPSWWKNNDIAKWESINDEGIAIDYESGIVEDLESIIDDNENNETERKSEILSRIGQGKFRNKLYKYWGGCSVTGCKVKQILKASHIKPWKDSNNKERVDVYNGLLLIPNIDSLFDRGFITFDSSGKILISKILKKDNYKILGISKKMKISTNENHVEYLRYHKNKVFIRV